MAFGRIGTGSLPVFRAQHRSRAGQGPASRHFAREAVFRPVERGKGSAAPRGPSRRRFAHEAGAVQAGFHGVGKSDRI